MTAISASPGPSSGVGTSSICSDLRGSLSRVASPSNISVSSLRTVTPRYSSGIGIEANSSDAVSPARMASRISFNRGAPSRVLGVPRKTERSDRFHSLGMLGAVTRRPILAFALLVVLVIVGSKVAASQHTQAPKPVTAATSKPKPSPTPTHAAATPTPSLLSGPSDARRLHRLVTITGSVTPKSVVASTAGFVTAQNMIYQHSITVYDDAS